MGIGIINRGVLILQNGVLEIFGHKGYAENDSWFINLMLGAFVEVIPEPASPEIEAVITQDIAEGKWDKIDHIVVSPNVALRLYLEGKITSTHIRSADTTDSAVVFNKVQFKGQHSLCSFMVVVRQTDVNVATMDRNGYIV
ncbi:hypothetical protein KKG46_04575 [Patescibacteria group bacterium]|nr:hypothetical protein [Patescibacteria group bacterium]